MILRYGPCFPAIEVPVAMETAKFRITPDGLTRQAHLRRPDGIGWEKNRTRNRHTLKRAKNESVRQCPRVDEEFTKVQEYHSSAVKQGGERMKEMQKIGQFVSVVIVDDWQRGFQLSAGAHYPAFG